MQPLFLKLDCDRFLRAIFLRVLRFPAGGLPYFGTSVHQTVDGDGGLRSRNNSSNNRILLHQFDTFCFKVIVNKDGF